MFLDPWEILSAFAYVQVFSFLQSMAALLVLILLSVVLPARLFRDKFAAQGCVTMFLVTFWAVVLVRHDFKVVYLGNPDELLLPGRFLLWLALCVLSVGVYWALVRRSRRLERAVNAFAERLTALLYMYVPVTFLSIVVVAVRNL